MSVMKSGTPFADLQYQYAAGVGLYLNTSRIATLGNNPDVDTITTPETIWSGADLGTIDGWDHKLIPITQTAIAMELVSDSVNDTAAGTGARTVQVVYLDSTYTNKTVTLTMNGTTAVAMPENVLRVNRMIVVTGGTFRGANFGNIKLRAVTGQRVYSHIPAPAVFPNPRGIARQSMYTTPAGMAFDVTSVIVSINRTDTNDRWGTFTLNTMGPAGVAIEGIELSVSTAMPYRHEADGMPVLTVPEKTDMWINCVAISQSNSNVTSGFIGIQRPRTFY